LEDLFLERFQQILEYRKGDLPNSHPQTELSFADVTLAGARKRNMHVLALPSALFPSPCDPLCTLFRRNGEFN